MVVGVDTAATSAQVERMLKGHHRDVAGRLFQAALILALLWIIVVSIMLFRRSAAPLSGVTPATDQAG